MRKVASAVKAKQQKKIHILLLRWGKIAEVVRNMGFVRPGQYFPIKRCIQYEECADQNLLGKDRFVKETSYNMYPSCFLFLITPLLSTLVLQLINHSSEEARNKLS